MKKKMSSKYFHESYKILRDLRKIKSTLPLNEIKYLL